MHGDSLFSKYEGFLLWKDFDSRYCFIFKASMPLLANFYFRNERFFVSIESQTVAALSKLFDELPHIIP